MASRILNDVDAASMVVVDTIVDASRRIHTFDSDESRARAALAASVYWRCVGALVLHERFGPSPDLPSAASLLNLSPACVLRQLEEVLGTYASRRDDHDRLPCPPAHSPNTEHGL